MSIPTVGVTMSQSVSPQEPEATLRTVTTSMTRALAAPVAAFQTLTASAHATSIASAHLTALIDSASNDGLVPSVEA